MMYPQLVRSPTLLRVGLPCPQSTSPSWLKLSQNTLSQPTTDKAPRLGCCLRGWYQSRYCHDESIWKKPNRHFEALHFIPKRKQTTCYHQEACRLSLLANDLLCFDIIFRYSCSVMSPWRCISSKFESSKLESRRSLAA